MDYTITTTKSRARGMTLEVLSPPFRLLASSKAHTKGMSIVELLVAMGLSGLVFVAVASQISFSARSFAALSNYVDLDIHSRNALDKMSTDIRQADRLVTYSPTNMQFETVDPGTGATNTLTYTYDAATATLNRRYAGQTTTLLKEVSPNSLQFSMFQRNPVGGSVDQYATTDPTLCKVVQMSWTCSRNILGKKTNTESVQSAKVMIRK